MKACLTILMKAAKHAFMKNSIEGLTETQAQNARGKAGEGEQWADQSRQ
jgi:hypothetical protein